MLELARGEQAISYKHALSISINSKRVIAIPQNDADFLPLMERSYWGAQDEVKPSVVDSFQVGNVDANSTRTGEVEPRPFSPIVKLNLSDGEDEEQSTASTTATAPVLSAAAPAPSAAASAPSTAASVLSDGEVGHPGHDATAAVAAPGSASIAAAATAPSATAAAAPTQVLDDVQEHVSKKRRLEVMLEVFEKTEANAANMIKALEEKFDLIVQSMDELRAELASEKLASARAKEAADAANADSQFAANAISQFAANAVKQFTKMMTTHANEYVVNPPLP